MARKHRSASPTQIPRNNKRLIWILLAVASIPVGIWLLFSSDNPRKPLPKSKPSYSVQTIRRAIENRDFAGANLQAQAIMAKSKPSNELLLLAAEANAQLGQLGEAIALCDRCADDGSEYYEASRWIPCELLLRDGQLSAAATRLEKLLHRFPEHTQARKRLIYVLGVCGRRWETQTHLLALIQQGNVELDTLVSLGETNRMPNSKQQLDRVAEKHPDDVLLRLGLARLALANNEIEQAIAGLSAITESSPDIAEAWARLGEALMLQQNTSDSISESTDALHQWNAALPESAEAHPLVWFVRASLAEQEGELESAARCLWEALHRDPNHVASLYQLGLTLQTLERDNQAKLLLERHQKLTEYIRAVDRVAGKTPELDGILQAASLAEQCGRLWEAWGWYGIARSIAPNDSLVTQQFSKLSSQLSTRPPQTVESLQPATLVNLSDYPLPSYSKPEQALSEATVDEPLSQASVAFIDKAKIRGIDFSYFSSPTPGAEGKHIYEFAGGGIAILDYDLDGWPDIYLTQGCPWPPSSDGDEVDQSSRPRNTLYQNLAGEHFRAAPPGLAAADEGFGQGVTVGDFNSDGFPDLYVANIGPNALFQNNGDGTFTDASELLSSEALSSQWTTSCLMTDLNTDGHPDIYDVNYLEGENLFSRVCVWPEGKRRICGPATFSPAQDQLLLNLGTNGFRNESKNMDLPSGNGLGIVAAYLDLKEWPQAKPIQLFVANDQQPNFLLAYEALAPQASMSETAVLMGLAYDAQGAAQACMGVAAGDANGDGLLDLFITNYHQESNALYVQQSPGNFADLSREARLRDPSYAMLGFGTQFLDADLDGDQDLVLTNGHLDDFTYLGQPYQMPPQCFRNDGDGRFIELEGKAVGPYFEGRYLGRSLARLDWNRDGRPDFIVSHLDAPAALLTNSTDTSNNYLAIELRGTQSPRDAIGARVTIWDQDQQWTQQLTAGDGYQASNQRQLIFGIGDAEYVERIQVVWPSGKQQEFASPLAANESYLLVEGRDSAGRSSSP